MVDARVSSAVAERALPPKNALAKPSIRLLKRSPGPLPKPVHNEREAAKADFGERDLPWKC